MSSSLTRRALLASTIVATAGLALPAAAAAAPALYRDADAPIASRVADLIARMTIEEKAAQLLCLWVGKAETYDSVGDFCVEKARTVLHEGMGQVARPGDYRGLPRWTDDPFRSVENTVRYVNDLQRFLVEETRLGIPALFHDELAHGLLAGDATVFPSPPALASTWDVELVERVYTVAAQEARSRGTTVALTPVLDLLRDPRYGRAEEFFGEDPFLVGQMGVAAVRGLQGRARPIANDRVFATLKHFVHGVPQGGLNVSPFDVSERGLREAFLVPFAATIAKTNAAAVMPSYNEVAGVPAHENRALLQDTGRGLLGFEGFYPSDYDGIGNLVTQHHVAADRGEAAARALRAGVQADLPEGNCYRQIPELVRQGSVPMAVVDRAVAAVLKLKFEAGLFERPYADAARARRVSSTSASDALASEAAAKALVLLTNDGLLPLRPRRGQTIAVIGPNALEPMFGGYSGATRRAVGIVDGIRRAAPPGVTIAHADGVWITPPDNLGLHRSYSQTKPIPPEDNRRRIAEAVMVARASDVVVLVVGDVPALTREAVDVAMPGDRRTLGLWGQQDELIDAVAATGKPIVALVLSGRPLAIGNLAEKAKALFQGWYLGQAGGTAFAEVLFGKVSPGGKLTVSMPRSVGDLPVYYDRHPSADANRYIEGERTALFPFGHGLCYTTFEVGQPRLAQATIRVGQTVDLTVDIVNIGRRTGEEVVQIYLRDDISSVPRPVLELKAFERVTLRAGEQRTLNFSLDADALALWDLDMKRLIEPGTFTIYAGTSSVRLKSTTLTVST